MFLNIEDVKAIHLSEDKCFFEIEFHSSTKKELEDFNSPETDVYPCIIRVHRSFTVTLRNYSDDGEISISR